MAVLVDKDTQVCQSSLHVTKMMMHHGNNNPMIERAEEETLHQLRREMSGSPGWEIESGPFVTWECRAVVYLRPIPVA